MEKIISYRIAYGQSMKNLEEDVNRLINKGYTPLGAIQFDATPEAMIGEYSHRLYMQAMVIFDKDEE